MTAHETRPTLRPVDDDDTGPPHDAGAERALIGAAILDPTAATLAEPGDFYRPAHETIWAALRRVNGDQPDRALALLEDLRTTGDANRVGGAPYIHDCMQACITPAAAPQYADVITRHARHRRALNALTRAMQRLDHVEDIDDVLWDVMDDVETAATDARRGSNGHNTWDPQDITAAITGTELDPPPCLLPRDDGAWLAYAGAVHSLSGEPESGKTWIALHGVVHELRSKHDVAYIDFEDRASRVVARLLALGAHPDRIRDHFRYIRPAAKLDADGRRALDRAVSGTTLVVIDGVTEAMTLHGLDLHLNADVATFYDLLPRRVASAGPAVILIDHVVKDSEKQGRWGIGGQHKLAGIDGVAYVVRTAEPFGRGKLGRSRVTVSKDRPGYVRETAIGHTIAEFVLDARNPTGVVARLEPPESMPVGQGGELRPTFLMGRVAAYVEANPGADAGEIEDAVKGKATYVRQALRCLVHEGYVEVRPGPNRAKHHHLLHPFDEDGGEGSEVGRVDLD